MEPLEKITVSDKREAYHLVYAQAEALIQGEPDVIANLANITALLKDTFNWWWVGFYLVKNNELVLGPFQGPVACTRISLGKGVCGTSWQMAQTLIVPDVSQFKGHIACSAASKSEIVVPVHAQGKVVGVLDVDSEWLNHFDDTDREGLERIVQLISGLL